MKGNSKVFCHTWILRWENKFVKLYLTMNTLCRTLTDKTKQNLLNISGFTFW